MGVRAQVVRHVHGKLRIPQGQSAVAGAGAGDPGGAGRSRHSDSGNNHYLPHTIHLHGVDHPFSADHGMPHDEAAAHGDHATHGVGTDGVAETSEMPALPGNAQIYRFAPRVAGTFFYHCHVQANVHILMGMQGMFVVEEARSNNSVQTLNIGAGQVRNSSVAVRERYDREYDLHYFDLFKKLSSTVQDYADTRLRLQAQHRDWNITEDSPNYFLLNGRSFPYTLQESLVAVKPSEKVKLRMLNGGSATLPFTPTAIVLPSPISTASR
ncbi:MAG: multicopper oxidase domain-containing protein [Gammaproteobacteria bacterium]|nr:multicopper oxidase domain-containing protein [Gammaproteobacteria bacterium]